MATPSFPANPDVGVGTIVFTLPWEIFYSLSLQTLILYASYNHIGQQCHLLFKEKNHPYNTAFLNLEKYYILLSWGISSPLSFQFSLRRCYVPACYQRKESVLPTCNPVSDNDDQPCIHAHWYSSGTLWEQSSTFWWDSQPSPQVEIHTWHHCLIKKIYYWDGHRP